MLGARKPQMSSEVFCEADAASPSNADMPSGTSNRLQEIISWMGDVSKVYHCGALGSGLAAKLANNYLSCTLLLANAEAMAMGIKLGLDRNLLFDVIRNSTGKNWMLENVCPAPGVVPHAPSSNNYKLGFKAQMLSKDVGLAVDAARSVGLEPVVGDAALDVFNLLGKEERFRVSFFAAYCVLLVILLQLMKIKLLICTHCDRTRMDPSFTNSLADRTERFA